MLDTHADRQSRRRPPDPPVRARQPDLVLPLASAAGRGPDGVRVVAVDQLDMGYSERTHTVHRLGDRVADLGGRVVGARHRRPGRHGGPRLGRPDLPRLGAGPSRPAARGRPARTPPSTSPRARRRPSIIRLARSAPLLRLNTVQTPVFVRGTSALSGRSMPRDVAAAFAAPYATPRPPGRGRRVRRRHPVRAGPPERRRPRRHRRRASGRSTCPCCCCGGRATRCSPTAT